MGSQKNSGSGHVPSLMFPWKSRILNDRNFLRFCPGIICEKIPREISIIYSKKDDKVGEEEDDDNKNEEEENNENKEGDDDKDWFDNIFIIITLKNYN